MSGSPESQGQKYSGLAEDFGTSLTTGCVVRVSLFLNNRCVRQVGDASLPPEQPEMTDDEFLQKLHHVLLEIHVMEGAMICPNCNHSYPISNGIPNMLLAEHEIG
ncbi:hypothetical protein L210DRAFT_3487084 [Boletus edulis BED1]|uniref:Trm112p-domain-containing protein n=1 Tax=Boletus edulis BED1 TaxID=1328754 RepID=A0AAD4G9K5_BOLED|nr:hypothetical protein L210DRAFT_3487084 [Boletus edulis BED1]